jgi:hypothetical protein
MPAPDDSDLADFLGIEVNADQVAAVISVTTSMANAYTRGEGFIDGEPNDDIRAVILTASARLLTNAAQVESETMGPFTVQYGSGFQGFTIGEQMTLNRYRKRAE